MAIALIFAGGTGTRMNSKSKPKQFLELYGKPIIIHTIEYFEKHHEVKEIAVVCLSPWLEVLKESIRKFNIKKVRWIVEGGKSGQESIYNGLKAIYNNCEKAEETIVLIHDGVRPLISERLISENIDSVRKFGSAITVGKAKETIVSVDSQSKINNIAERADSRIAKAPQSFYLNEIYKVHKDAIRDGIQEMTDSATLMKYYGYTLQTVESGSENIKITTPTDFYIFRAVYEARENSQIFGFEVKE